MKSNSIKDVATRDAVKTLEVRMKAISSVPQLSAGATLEQVIKAVNKMTDSVKR